MLDEADFINRYDKSNVLGLVGQMPAQLGGKLELKGELTGEGIRNVVVAAMGGSAVPVEFLLDLAGERLTLPVQVVRSYELPGYVSKATLVVASSYSGTTEESLQALKQAEKQGARIAVVTGGEKLVAQAGERGWPSVRLPAHAVPRLGALSGILAWAAVFGAIGQAKGLTDELKGSARVLWAGVEAWRPEVPTHENPAKQLAEELLGHAVVVYAGPAMRSLAWKWKIDLNEGAHNLAFWNTVPELNHNEMSSWEFPRKPGVKVVELRTDLDSDRVNQRFEIMNGLLSNRFAPVEVRAPAGSRLDQMLWVWLLGSYVSAYLGLLNQIDPAELPLVKKLKERLGSVVR